MPRERCRNPWLGKVPDSVRTTRPDVAACCAIHDVVLAPGRRRRGCRYGGERSSGRQVVIPTSPTATPHDRDARSAIPRATASAPNVLQRLSFAHTEA
jgi:hypothetical protein